MVSLEQYKATLGSRVDEMSEEKIIYLMDLQRKTAVALFDMWIKETRKISAPKKMDNIPLPDKI